MKLYAFKCGGEKLDRAVFDPFDPLVGEKLYVPYFFFLIEHPNGRVLFDTGVHPELITEPRARLGDAADGWEHDLKAGDDVRSQLRAIDLDVADVTEVAMSHLHYDHSGGLAYFDDCIVHIQADELKFAHYPPPYAAPSYIADDFRLHTKWHELWDDYDVFDDGKVVLFRTPGHTPGHQSCLVRLDKRPIILLGDAALSPESLEKQAIPAAMGAWSPDATLRSWARIEELRDRLGAELIFTHNPNYEADVQLAPDNWYE